MLQDVLPASFGSNMQFLGEGFPLRKTGGEMCSRASCEQTFDDCNPCVVGFRFWEWGMFQFSCQVHQHYADGKLKCNSVTNLSDSRRFCELTLILFYLYETLCYKILGAIHTKVLNTRICNMSKDFLDNTKSVLLGPTKFVLIL